MPSPNFERASLSERKKRSGHTAASAFIIGLFAVTPPSGASEVLKSTDPQVLQHRMEETLRSLGGKGGLFNGVTIGEVPFSNAFPKNVQGSGTYSAMPNPRDPEVWNEEGAQYWIRGKCKRTELFLGFSMADPKEVKVITEPWDNDKSHEVLPGGPSSLPEWVRKICGTGNVS